MVEDRLLAVVEFYYPLLLGRDEGDVAAYLLIDFLIVDVDVGKTVIEEVAQDSGGLGILREEQPHAFVFRDSLPGAFPFFNQGAEFRHQHCG